MGLDTSILTNAWAHIRANPNMSQADQESYLADAMKAFVESANVIYQPNLTSTTGGAVSAVVPTDTIGKLQ